MNKFVKHKGGPDGTPGEHESVSLPKEQAGDHVCEKPPPKKRKFDPDYNRYGFTEGDSGKPLCIVCLQLLSTEANKPGKLKRHLDTKHPQYKDKDASFFKRKEEEYVKQKSK